MEVYFHGRKEGAAFKALIRGDVSGEEYIALEVSNKKSGISMFLFLTPEQFECLKNTEAKREVEE